MWVLKPSTFLMTANAHAHTLSFRLTWYFSVFYSIRAFRSATTLLCIRMNANILQLCWFVYGCFIAVWYEVNTVKGALCVPTRVSRWFLFILSWKKAASIFFSFLFYSQWISFDMFRFHTEWAFILLLFFSSCNINAFLFVIVKSEWTRVWRVSSMQYSLWTEWTQKQQIE